MCRDDNTRYLETQPITTVNILLLAALREPEAVRDLLPVLFPATQDPMVSVRPSLSSSLSIAIRQ